MLSSASMSDNNYEYYVDGIALTSVSLFGLVGTILSIRVLVPIR
jgi:hypothetical protein